jgi:hypothetical protein
MAVSVTAALLTLREFLADERNALIEECCDPDPRTGRPDLSSLPPDQAAVIDEYTELLTVADEALIAEGIDPQPQPTNVLVFPMRRMRPVLAVQSDGRSA